MGSHRTNVPLRRKQNRPEAEEKDLETTDLLTGPAIAATAAKAQSLGVARSRPRRQSSVGSRSATGGMVLTTTTAICMHGPLRRVDDWTQNANRCEFVYVIYKQWYDLSATEEPR